MRSIHEKVQRLSRRAAELRETMQAVPPKIAEIKHTVASTAADFQKLRADVLSSVATLRAETDGQFQSALREIEGATHVFERAGCRLDRLELELGTTRRLLVHLTRVAAVEFADLAALVAAQAARPAVHAILTAMLKADELSRGFDLKRLRYTNLTVAIGLIPSVRIGWEAATHTVAPTPTRPAHHDAEAGETPRDVDGSSEADPESTNATMFARRPMAAEAEKMDDIAPRSTPTGAAMSVPALASAVSSTPAIASDLVGDWRRGALDRFKRMPDLGRRSE